eukprot:357274-Chlamydomonas_euryale.AAC.31
MEGIDEVRTPGMDYPLFTTINAIVKGKLQPIDVTRHDQACHMLLAASLAKKAEPAGKKMPMRAPLTLTMTSES